PRPQPADRGLPAARGGLPERDGRQGRPEWRSGIPWTGPPLRRSLSERTRYSRAIHPAATPRLDRPSPAPSRPPRGDRALPHWGRTGTERNNPPGGPPG